MFICAFGFASLSAQDIEAGLELHYTFAGSADDQSGNGNDGVINGATLTTDRFGSPDAAYSFSSNANITMPVNTIRNSTTGSISLWFKTGSNGSLVGQQNKAYSSTPNQHIGLLYVGTDGKLRGKYWDSYTQSALHTSSSVVNDDNWHHVVIASKGSSQTLFLDGVEISTINRSINHLSMSHNQLGVGYTTSWPSAQSGWFDLNGSIDDVRYYNRALNAEDVEALYDLVSDNNGGDMVDDGTGGGGNGGGGNSGGSSSDSTLWTTVDTSIVFNGGNVGIGVSNPGSKLAVNGLINATAVEVTATIPVPDYVFSPDYQLPSLQSVKEYIEKNRHLPEIPSEEIIKRDGINLGEMDLRLLKKIEELTLYQIALQQELEILKNELETLRTENE